MRARHFRPRFDSLDTRLVLDDSTAAALGLSVTGGVSIVVSANANGAMPGEDVSPGDVYGWIVAGDPPSGAYDPSNPTIDSSSYLTVTSSN